ncbi:Rch1p Ecym_2305 [Eremothecium cymbalariae DBVPG|uniref:Sodium/bile acid cotransporter 7 n=1 Tax=Eremothecium cymbalariae (strain CBS 270.75 / DBVPG 7215 / KCTC 17166 / NRRL Y-17582) TaxID=931890 RepID=G8JQ45_ERECY|nr:Hypothetical protein Ecym_2305 [Eremothecium cymbalariae DBVPG\
MSFSQRIQEIRHNRSLRFIGSQWFFIVLGVLVTLAYFFPSFGRNGGTIHAEYTIGYGAVALIFLQTGLSMSSKKLLVNIFNWRAHFVVLLISFLVTSAIMYGICCGLLQWGKIDEWVIVGLVLVSACPTTIASNVMMTKDAGGNESLSVCEVFIENVLGTFLTPAIVQLYTSSGQLKFGNPASDSSLSILYRSVMKQLGISLFIPLAAGQLLQNMFPTQVSWALKNLNMGTISSFCLLLIMWSSFSTAFHQKAFESVSHLSIIFLVFFVIGIFLLFTLISYFMARPPLLDLLFRKELSEQSSKVYQISYHIFKPFYYSKRDTIAVMFCGASKTGALGVSLITAQYGNNFRNLGKLLVPLTLYQTEQIVISSLLVPLFRRWCSDENERMVKENTGELDIESSIKLEGQSSKEKKLNSNMI